MTYTIVINFQKWSGTPFFWPTAFRVCGALMVVKMGCKNQVFTKKSHRFIASLPALLLSSRVTLRFEVT